MNTKRFLMLVLCTCILGGCQEPPTIPTPISTIEPTDSKSVAPTATPRNAQTLQEPVGGASFAIYLIADPEIAGPDLADWELEALPLAEEPLISIEDIRRYDWENHAFDVTEESYQRLMDEIGRNVSVNGKPFVVIAKGERIYAGAFWTLASSLSFDGVVIMDPAFASNVSLWLALGYPSEEYFTGQDPRGDPRIREALEEAGLLQ